MLVPLHKGRLLQPGGVRRGYNEGGGKDCERIKPLPLFDVLAHTHTKKYHSWRTCTIRHNPHADSILPHNTSPGIYSLSNKSKPVGVITLQHGRE